MASQNNTLDPELIDRVRQARDLLNEVIQSNGITATKTRKVVAASELSRAASINPDFSMPIRPFIKAYCSKMSGAQKFTLLVAYLNKGDDKKNHWHWRSRE